MMTPGLVISAPASGAGKTMVTLGLLAALRAAGLAVQPFKNGPDYIDPAFHAAAAGRPSYNLDSWAMGETRLAGLASFAQGTDLVLAEGSMGLFDGVASAGELGNGASAELAARAGWPVVLVLDVSGQAQSAAAVALGFARMAQNVRLAGVILNKVASPRHEALIRDGMARAGIEVLGALPRRSDLTLPERHLGLVQAGEHEGLAETLSSLGSFVASHVDLDRLRRLASGGFAAARPVAVPPPGQRVALAWDEAFSFVYPHLLEGWRAAGADILPFSPVADQAPDDSADACWLPGGYPELHAGPLAAAEGFRAGLNHFARTRPVHGECGGYMAMGQVLVDAQGNAHRMAGLLGLETSFARRKMHLGYRLARLEAPIPGYDAGSHLRGHEFHYATILTQPDQPLAHVEDANGAAVPETGSRCGLATGSFFHMIAQASA
ncbi:cobyrinate a,c-diamide synthase [Novosphingobium rosa]|uniref:cobyrinate a,c-diamide synthase n=1 Tax=Novosphingobium rosa TaxID=76978 RepID=UPI00083502F1|nr:cobyrinate a,c-diamide synthase [Novosphingobium rosa]